MLVMKQLFVIFVSIFLAEIGDKTQLATLLFATDKTVSRTGVFAAAAAALITSTLIAVLAGELVSRFVSPATLKTAAGVGFVLVGIWTLARE
jgi:putative Ca2+/H+ antiporter (TMEM165/GDT1 family)